MCFPWDSFASAKMEQLRNRYGRVLFPNWLCFHILYLLGFYFREDRPWNDYYSVSFMGMTAYKFGDYKLAKKCSEQFLKLQAVREKYSPSFFTVGFSLAAIISLKEKDSQKLQYFLNKKLENKMISEFSFMGDDKELLMELVRAGQKDIAVDYMRKRAKNFLSNPAVVADIAYVESGKMPFTVEYYEMPKPK